MKYYCQIIITTIAVCLVHSVFAKETGSMDCDAVHTAQFFLTEKLKNFNNICSLCMAWWTSSVVFSAVIVSGVWLKERDIIDLPYFHLLGAAIGVFFISLILFGVFIFAYTFCIDSDLAGLVKSAGGGSNSFHLEVFLLRLSIADAISSFLLIIAAWIVLWRILWLKRVKNVEQANKAVAM